MPSLLDARRTAAALIAVALSAALIAFAFIVSDSYTTQLTANARLSIKGADVVVTTADLHDDGEVLDDNLISQLEAVDDVASVRGEHWDVLRLDLPEQLTRAVGATVVAQDVPALSEHTTLTAGRLPQADGEVAVNTRLAEQQGLGVGDTIRLTDHDRTVRTSSTVVGIVSPGADTTLDPSDVMVYATPKQLAAMGATTAYHCLYVDAKPGVSTGTLVSEVERVVHAVQPGASVMDADTAVAQRAVSSTSGGATMSTMLNLLAPVCALVSAIVITTTFTALVARQTRTTGLLRCIGASRRQIMGAVLRTAALTGLIGSVAGAGLGAVAGTVLIRSGVIEDLGADQLTITPASLAVTIVLGAAVTLIAVLRPARRASRISPLVAITGQTVGVNRTRKRRWAAVSGLVLILTGGVLLVSGMTGHNLYIVAGGAALIALGILAALPLLIVLIVSITGRVGAKGRYPLLHLAARNLVRNPGRSTATAATLLIGVMIGSTLFVGLFSFSSSFQSILNQASPTDITIFGVTPQTDSAALTSTIRSIDGVQGTVLVPILDLTQTVNGSTRQTDVVSIDTATIAPIVRSTEGLEDLDDNTLIVGEIYDIPDGAAVTLTRPRQGGRGRCRHPRHRRAPQRRRSHQRHDVGARQGRRTHSSARECRASGHPRPGSHGQGQCPGTRRLQRCAQPDNAPHLPGHGSRSYYLLDRPGQYHRRLRPGAHPRDRRPARHRRRPFTNPPPHHHGDRPPGRHRRNPRHYRWNRSRGSWFTSGIGQRRT